MQSTAPSGPWLFPAPDLWGDKVFTFSYKIVRICNTLSIGTATGLVKYAGLSRQAHHSFRSAQGEQMAISPSAGNCWPILAHATQVIVGTGTRNYTAGDAPQLLDDLGLEQQVCCGCFPAFGSPAAHAPHAFLCCGLEGCGNCPARSLWKVTQLLMSGQMYLAVPMCMLRPRPGSRRVVVMHVPSASVLSGGRAASSWAWS